MSDLTDDKLQKLLTVIPVIIFNVLITTLISFVLACVTLIQLVAVVGWSREISLVVAILVAMAVNLYIWLQPMIRNFITRSSNI